VARLAQRRHSLLWTRHNVLLDGWSFARLFDDLLRLHAAIRDGEPEPALATPASFRHYVDWQAPLAEPAAAALWDGFVRHARPAHLFEPEAGPHAGPYRELRMPLPAEVEPFVLGQRLTLSTLLEAAWAAVLAGHTGTDDVRYGLVFSTRPTRLQELAPASLESVRRRAGGPLWDTLLLLHNYPHGFDATLPGQLRIVETQGFSQVGAALTVSVDPQPLRLAMLFDPARADERTVRRLGAGLAAVLALMVADPDRPVADLLAAGGPA
jgi:hypothetical protein